MCVGVLVHKSCEGRRRQNWNRDLLGEGFYLQWSCATPWPLRSFWVISDIDECAAFIDECGAVVYFKMLA